MKTYGKELIIDLHNCNPSLFTRKSIRKYCKELCKLIDMKAEKLVFWDDLNVPDEFKQTDPHTTGTSAVQFILTSNITIHTLDLMKRVYINIFSCKDFNVVNARDFTQNFFKGVLMNWEKIDRY